MVDTREIPLSQGKVAIIDAADYELVSAYKWYAAQFKSNGYWYAVRTVENGKSLQRMHRFIMNIDDSTILVDHKSRNSLDNRRDNLRVSNYSQNSANHRMYKNNTSGYYGVTYDASRKKWKAQIMVNRKCLYLGRFDSLIEAARVRDLAAVSYFGEFAVLNLGWLRTLGIEA